MKEVCTFTQRREITSIKFSTIHRFQGFTLVELLVVLAIVSILFSFALPSYRSFTLKGQRTEGQALLLEIQTNLERYYFHHQHYPGKLSELKNYRVDDIDSEHLYYQVSLDRAEQSCPADSCYLLKAKHMSGQEKETLSLYSSGERQGPW